MRPCCRSPKWRQASGSEQPVPGRDGAVPPVAAAGHEFQAGGRVVGERPYGTASPMRRNRQMGTPRDHAAGPLRWLVLGRWARNRDMDRHAMQSKVGYLFSGLWRGKERRGKEQRERRGEGGRDRSCLFKREMEKGRDSGWKLKINLPQWMGREWAWLVS